MKHKKTKSSEQSGLRIIETQFHVLQLVRGAR